MGMWVGLLGIAIADLGSSPVSFCCGIDLGFSSDLLSFPHGIWNLCGFKLFLLLFQMLVSWKTVMGNGRIVSFSFCY